MERSEPTLVPEWLKGTGAFNCNSSSAHSATADDRGVRSRSSVSNGDYGNGPRANIPARVSSNYFRRSSSSNSSMLHDRDSSYARPYSSFERNNRDRDKDKDRTKNNHEFRGKDRSVFEEKRDYFDTDILSGRFEKEMLRRSQSMKLGKSGEDWPRRVVTELNNVYSSHNNNGVGMRNATVIRKSAFDKDFPSLGAEERVMTSGVSTAVQSLPMGSSPIIGGIGWTSALVEVPVTVGSNSTGHHSPQQTATPIISSSTPTTSNGRNMAEILAQIPAQSRTTPQAFAETQRLKELALKKSRQLIPMTSLSPKNSILNSEKQKLKVASRSDSSSLAKKAVQQQLLFLYPQKSSQRVGQPAQGILILKPAGDNGISSTTKDTLSPSVSGIIAKDPVSFKRPFNSQVALVTQLPSMEKKPVTSQAKSRSDFFNLMRKKTSSSVVSDASEKKSCEPVSNESISALVSPQSSDIPLSSPQSCDVLPSSPQSCDVPPSSPQSCDILLSSPQSSNVIPSSPNCSIKDVGDIVSNGNFVEQQFQQLDNNEESLSVTSDAILYPYEEEVTFLRSLGWEENSGEEEALTEEEINAFYREYSNLRPSANLERRIQIEHV